MPPACPSTKDGEYPWALLTDACFECRDAIAMGFGERKIVPAVEQAHAADRIDGKRVGSVIAEDALALVK